MGQDVNGQSNHGTAGHANRIGDMIAASNRPSRRRQSEPLYSPRKVAAAIGVSESSLKRWCDAGYVRATKTAGGHRRVKRSEVISFIKRKNYDLRNPTAIDLPDISQVSVVDDRDAISQLMEALKSGDEAACKRLLVYMFINGRTVPDLFDRIITPAFEQIGDGWNCGEMEIYQERIACQVCYNAILEIRSLIPDAREGAPLAIGCTLEGDHYQLATLGVEICLSTHGWRARSLGSHIPIQSLERAVEEYMPRLIWISVSHIQNPTDFVNRVNELCQRVAGRSSVILGGNAVTPDIRVQLRNATYCDNFAQLILAAQNLNPIGYSFVN